MKEKKTAEQSGALVNTEEDTVTIPLLDIFRQLKKNFFLWLLIAVIGAGLVFSGSLITASSRETPLTAMVGFTFNGIEEGLDPNGNEFNVNDMKSPLVIENTLTELGMEESLVDTIRSSITISGLIPDDAIDELTAYLSIFNANNSIEAAQRAMDVTYYPTRYEIQFTYANTSMDRAEAAEFLNEMLSNYKEYFMQQYGYNDALGNALTTVDYTGYDYPQALDVLSDTLTSMQNYVTTLKNNDTNRFRSAETGYSFSDLSDAVDTLRTVDYSTLSAYIIGKNVTRDRSSLSVYYQYRLDNLNRSLQSAKENLATITDSINNYQKDSIIIMSNADSANTTEMTQTSEAYDNLITQKIDAQSRVSQLQQQISEYQSRIDALQSATTVGSKQDQEKVDADMVAFAEKINNMVLLINQTADEYFETVVYTNSYSVLVPASGSFSSAVSVAMSNMTRPLLIVEALLFVLYLIYSVVRAFMISYRRSQTAIESANGTELVAAETAESVAPSATKTESDDAAASVEK